MTARPTPKVLRLALAAAVLASACGLRGAAPANRLAGEKSPYLHLHASDPVDWYPWGPEAFSRARSENKPIFLSVGYSTCHWCHVMERESFSDPVIAGLLNASFVCVLVDREERPDLDRVYQTFVQASTGEGGWPLSAWLTPDLKPFFGGTYFGPESRPGQPSFREVIARIADTWAHQRDEVLHSADQMLAALASDLRSTAAPGVLKSGPARARAVEQALQSFDPNHGGFEQSPKFPQAALIDFLLDEQATATDPGDRASSLSMALATLRAMAAGGIHDRLGGGFHRYSVDAAWRVPHFEKMLSDQAQLAVSYLCAWQVTADPALRDCARDTLDYVRRDLTSGSGGFYSAEDADSAPKPAGGAPAEGAFYVWTLREVEAALGPSEAPLAEYAYGVTEEGNASPGMAGQNVLYLAHPPGECAARFGISEEVVRSRLDAASRLLGRARSGRPRPVRDEKILTAWNGLMISAFARSAQVLGSGPDAATAAKAAGFIRDALYDGASGALAHSFCDGRRDGRAFSEDYAFLVQGLLDLYEATFDTQWLRWAEQLQQKQVDLFLDTASGGFFANTADDPAVVLRLKEDNDGAEPSSNSVSVRNLSRLSAMLDRKDWRDLASRTAQSLGPQIERAPTALPLMLAAMGWLEGSPLQVIIDGDPADPRTAALVGQVWARFLPRHVLVRVDPESRPFFSKRLAIVDAFPADPARGPTAYVCRNFACQLPTGDTAVLARLLAAPEEAPAAPSR